MIHPWDAALDEQEWRSRPADGHDSGQLVVNGLPLPRTRRTQEDTSR